MTNEEKQIAKQEREWARVVNREWRRVAVKRQAAPARKPRTAEQVLWRNPRRIGS